MTGADIEAAVMVALGLSLVDGVDAVRKLGGREFTAVAVLAKTGLIKDGARGSGSGGNGMGVADDVAFSLLL